MLTQSALKKYLTYNPDTGAFTRINSFGGYVSGSCAGSVNANGYIYISINKRKYLAHRLAVLYMTGRFPLHDTDHINGIRTDNRFNNLRQVTRSGNMKNSAISIRNKSKVVGVYWRQDKARWVAEIQSKNKRHRLGFYKDKFDAICARKSAEIKYKFHENHGKVLINKGK